MKRLPKYTPAEVRNDPYGFTYKEMSEVIGENEAKALYEEVSFRPELTSPPAPTGRPR